MIFIKDSCSSKADRHVLTNEKVVRYLQTLSKIDEIANAPSMLMHSMRKVTDA